MLERIATRCINRAGGEGCKHLRQLRRQSLPLQKCRRLHAAFWTHGGGDLDIISTLYLNSVGQLFEPADDTTTHDDAAPMSSSSAAAAASASSSASAQTQPFLLDFLYPPETRAYFQRISFLNDQAWKRRFSLPKLDPCKRTYSSGINPITAVGDPSSISATTLDAPAFTLPPSNVALDEYKENHTLPTTSQRLEHGRSLRETDRAELALRHVMNVCTSPDPPVRSVEEALSLIPTVLEFPDAPALSQIRHLFDLVPIEERQGSTYISIMDGFVRKAQVGPAILLGQAGLEAGLPADDVTAIARRLLHIATANGFWQSAIELWEGSVLNLASRSDSATTVVAVAEDMAHSPTRELRPAVWSLVCNVHAFPALFEDPQRRQLVAAMISLVLKRGDSFGTKANVTVLECLKRLDQLDVDLYETLVCRTLTSGGAPLSHRVNHGLRAYNTFRKPARGADGPPAFTPPLKVLRTLLNAASQVKTDGLDAIRTLHGDWEAMHGTPLIRDTNMFMNYFAKQGDFRRLLEAFNAYVAAHKKERTTRLFHPIIHAYALLGDPETARSWMRTMKEEYGIKPDVRCWNMLIHAHQRRSDLDGALNAMAAMLDAGHSANDYTFGTVMAAIAERGDLELLRSVEEAAASLKVETSQAMHDCHVLTLLNDDSMGLAVQYATRVTESSPDTSDKTRMWNQIMTTSALGVTPTDGRLRRFEALANKVQRLGVPYDALTFAATMRAYTLAARTGAAQRVLLKIMPRLNIPATAFHYAIVISGFVNEGQFNAAYNVHAQMLRRNVRPDGSSRLALLKLTTNAARDKSMLRKSRALGGEGVADLTLQPVKELMDELTVPDPQTLVAKSPRISAMHFNAANMHPGIYFDFLARTYGTLRAFDIVKQLVERYETGHDSQISEAALPLMASIMRLKYFTKDAQAVEELWQLAKSRAVAASSDGVPPKSDKPGMAGLSRDADANADVDADGVSTDDLRRWRLPAVSRFVLAAHLDIYLKHLAGRREYGQMRAVVDEVTALGFELDNGNWNNYVQLIATGGFQLEAFDVCERVLMPGFDGWRFDQRLQYGAGRAAVLRGAGRASAGLEYQSKLNRRVDRAEKRITYKTAARLALIVRRLRGRALAERSAQEMLRRLESEAPSTWAAVRTMPTYDHPIATHVLGTPSRGVAERRRMPEMDINGL